MSNINLTPGVLFFVFISLSISVMSLYVSRRYLPTKMKSAYLKSITALAAAVETKDSGTVGHAQRVAQLAVAVARRLDLQGHILERIEYAALLMDIGKANVPQAILNKKNPLTEAEWMMIQSHSGLGSEMVAAVPFLADLQGYILHHHEYWDGSGYPEGLQGEDIPLPSRILAVAADYDAMISQRPYHPHPMTHTEAINEIKRYLGTKYDPNVGKAFVEMMSESSMMDK
ncbi:MAG: HD-GYP domain-containing protein [Armatimonadota bacterium]|nr:HD-GYP domain-containing protein [bacterium]